MGINTTAVGTYKNFALNKIRASGILTPKLAKRIEDKEALSDEEQNIINELKDIIFNSNMIFVPDEKYKQEKINIDSELFIEKLDALENLKIEKMNKKYESIKDILGTSTDELKLSRRTYNCLYKVGITTLGKIGALKESELLKIENLGISCLAEIKAKLDEYDIPRDEEFWEYYKPEEQECTSMNLTPIKTVGFSNRVNNSLSRAGFKSLEEIINLTDDELLPIRGLGEKRFR